MAVDVAVVVEGVSCLAHLTYIKSSDTDWYGGRNEAFLRMELHNPSSPPWSRTIPESTTTTPSSSITPASTNGTPAAAPPHVYIQFHDGCYHVSMMVSGYNGHGRYETLPCLNRSVGYNKISRDNDACGICLASFLIAS